ncbi:hypothetical protein N4T77_00115 [Clostridium sp. CX1]|uniref:hypothetical protein n=1 Tax=Clostridium sp. CX1 TaxID=2978346 RepID=UPI0021C1ACAE|nr:hypothetical protein [Clostridium sp. CX1]MCT8974992.1 hypothetical protein [Clostridium sp. CX1]
MVTKESIYKEIIKYKFMEAAAKAISLVAGCLSCNKLIPNNHYTVPSEIASDDVIEIFSNYSSLPWDDFEDLINIREYPCMQEGFLGMYSELDVYGSLIIYIKYLYLSILEGTEVVCIDYGSDDYISNSFLFIKDGILYSISFQIMYNLRNCNFVNTTIEAYDAINSEVAKEYYKELERYQYIAEYFYEENYIL